VGGGDAEESLERLLLSRNLKESLVTFIEETQVLLVRERGVHGPENGVLEPSEPIAHGNSLHGYSYWIGGV